MKYPIIIAGVILAFVLLQHGIVFQLGGNYFRGQQEQLANSKAREIVREVEARVGVVRGGANTLVQRNDELFRRLLGQPDERAAATKVARQISTNLPLIEDLGVIDQNGRSQMVGEKSVLDASVERAASKIMTAPAGTMPVIVQPDTPQPYFYAVAPLTSENGRRAAAVIRFSAQTLTMLLTQRTISGHEVLLVDTHGPGPAMIVGGTSGISAGPLLPESDAFSRISARAQVSETPWEAVVFTDANLHSDFFWFRIRILSLSAGLVVVAILVMLGFVLRRERDRRAVLVALRQSEERFRELSDAAFEGIVFFDPTEILDANRAAERLFGYGRGELNGRSFADLISPEHRVPMSKLRKMGPDRTGETLGMRKDGSAVHIEFASKAIEYEGRPARVAALRDVSVRKKLERMQRDFVANVSHELRTPLTSIRGALGLITGRTSETTPEKRQQLVDIAHRNAERLTLLVEDILDFEKMAEGELTYGFEPMALRPLLARAVEINGSYVEGLGARIELEGTIPDKLIKGDAHRLMQVLTNLISNAAKFSPPDGVVTIRTAAEAGAVRVEVADSGPGVPAHFVDHLFQRFQQADTAEKVGVAGTGLGLAISKSIVDAHGGAIGYRPGAQGGAIFYFSLPVALRDSSRPDRSSSVSDAA